MAVVAAVRAVFVENGAESVELLLQLGEGVRGGLSGQPVFEAAVEALDLPLGLRVAG